MPRVRPRLLLATTSADKIRELRQILADLPLELVSPPELGLALDVEESGATFRENAELKVRAYWQASGLPCLAEDSGFEVEALGGAPGVHSARWEGSDYQRKNRLILERLAGLSGPDRRCRYVCEMAFIGPDARLERARGELIGEVAERPAGSGGFGYDPIFLLPSRRRTLAELRPDEKHTLSHRAQAAQKLRPALEKALIGGQQR